MNAILILFTEVAEQSQTNEKRAEYVRCRDRRVATP